MEQGVAGLGAMVGYRLKEAQSALRSRMDEALRPLGLTTPQYSCLELLSRMPGASSSDLARGVFVTRQTMSSLVDGLAARGLVQRTDRASSGRVLPTTLTSAGEQALAEAAARVEEIQAQMVSTLDANEVHALHTALTRCIDALNSTS